MGKPKNNTKTADGTVDPRDVFQTPPYAVDPLLPYLRAAGVTRVWESACGQGYLAQWLANGGLQVMASDLATGHDRFTTRVTGVDAEVTNVPFSRKYQWTARACQDGHPFALLMPSDALFAGTEMWPLIDAYGLQFLLPDKRIDYKPPTKGWAESSAQMHTCWVTRGLGLPEFVTRCRIQKPSRTALRAWDSGQLPMVDMTVAIERLPDVERLTMQVLL